MSTRSRSRCAVIVLALMMLAAGLAPGPTRAQAETRLYVGHSARLTAQIPGDWTVPPDGPLDYAGEDGFAGSFPLDAVDLPSACSQFAASPLLDQPGIVDESMWAGQPACQVSGSMGGNTISALVVPHPYPFTMWAVDYSFAVLFADPAHFTAIAASMSFDPNRIKPGPFVMSVIDLAEARAYWTNEVDWDAVREHAQELIEAAPSMLMAHLVLEDVVTAMHVGGDNHSGFLTPEEVATRAERDGYGFLLAGNRVLAVYPNSPASYAGLRVGDLIRSANGEPFEMPTGVSAIDPYPLFGSDPVQFLIDRPNRSDPVSITIWHGEYTSYLSPIGGELSPGVGYLQLPAMLEAGRSSDYARTANLLLKLADQRTDCGWILDLRLDQGGAYDGMIVGAGEVLGNGRFLGWESANGRQSWVTYENGQLFTDGQLTIAWSIDLYQLEHGDAPVAILVGPKTASAGEATAMAFVGRADTRFFGEQTGGLTTGVVSFPLFDGSSFNLAAAAMTDRNGTTYLDGIPPDQEVAIDWNSFGTIEDPVIIAAMEWLDEQPACAGVTALP